MIPTWPAELTPCIVAARRTPFTRRDGALAGLDEATLGAALLRALADDLPDAEVDQVVLGSVLGPGGNLARVVALAAGFGQGVRASTVDRQCGSGLEAIHQAALMVGTRLSQVVIAGGVQCVSQLPSPPPRAAFAPAIDGDPDLQDPDMGIAAQQLADTLAISRAAQDTFAIRSHERALEAAQRGMPEIVAVQGVCADDRPRRLRADVLARLPGAFRVGGSVSAGNSSADADGAAGVLIVPEHLRARLGVPGLAITGIASVGCSPAVPGLGAGLAIAELEPPFAVVEIVEAFATQVLANCATLHVDPTQVNQEGGAIAVGHPWAASGAFAMLRLFSQLVRRDLARTGVAACAIGGGQGLAISVERVG